LLKSPLSFAILRGRAVALVLWQLRQAGTVPDRPQSSVQQRLQTVLSPHNGIPNDQYTAIYVRVEL